MEREKGLHKLGGRLLVLIFILIRIIVFFCIIYYILYYEKWVERLSILFITNETTSVFLFVALVTLGAGTLTDSALGSVEIYFFLVEAASNSALLVFFCARSACFQHIY